MNISDRGVALIKTFEGCRLKAYPDPKTGGAPWTIGYGWTGKVDGKPVTPDT
ncbi:lysozyme, partial [Salmonella enterica subsp. enterica]|nr:lysozyme [Salmonella enterica]EBP4061268.1 lysozyme [Salmonella enterica subsp. enterica]EBQ8821376.1 muraminidase [Salmonella enterica subsp. enterica serovar Kisarawe]EDI0749359.1 lysozyme [Salmonella enterica subsp. enterica serovar Kisarawe]EDV1002404.1 lysozyme [Salmonella enterica subsp. enterica]